MLKDLIARMRLDTKPFASGLRGMEASLRQSGQRMRSIGQTMAVSITAPVLAVAAATRASADNLVVLKNQAAIADMSAQDFATLAMAADDVGISQEKLADILKDVNDRVGEFNQTGGGPMKDFFEKIAPKVGITADAFRGLSGADALQLYVSSLEKAGVSQAEMTFYLEAMAGDAAKLAPIFRDNGKVIEETAKRARDLGLSIDDNLIGSAQQVSNNFKDVTFVLGIQLQQALVRLAPAIQQMMTAVVPVIERIARGISDLAQGFSGLSPETQKTVLGMLGFAAVAGPVLVGVGAIVSGIGVVVGALRALALAAVANPIGAVIAAVALGAGLIYANWERIGTWFSGIWGGIKAVATSAWDAVKATWGAAGAWFAAEWANITLEATLAWDNIKGAWNGVAAWFTTTLAALPGVFRAIWKDIKAVTVQWVADFLAIGGQIVDGLKAGIQAKWDQMVAWFEGLADGLTADFKGWFGIQSPSRVFREIGRFITEGLGIGLRDGTKEVEEAMQGVKDAVGGSDPGEPAYEFRNAFSQAFADVALRGENLGQSLRRSFSNLASSAASSLFSSGFNGLWGALGLPTNANGTNNFAGGLTQVNERGGEIMNLPGGTQIIPHDISKRMADRSGGGSLNVTVTMDPSTGALGAFVRTEAGQVVAQAAPVLVRQSVAATYEKAREYPLGRR